MKTLCLYRDNCMDSFTAAWVYRKSLSYQSQQDPERWEAADYVTVDMEKSPEEPPLSVAGRRVVILGFTYPRKTIEKLCRQAHSLEIVDHRLASMETIYDLRTTNLIAVVKPDTSVSMLSWLHLYGDKCPPWPVKCMEDFVWSRKSYRNGTELKAVLDSYPWSFSTWDTLELKSNSTSMFERLIIEGSALLRDRKTMVELARARASKTTLFDEYEVLAAESCVYMEAIADRLAQESPFGVCWYGSGENERTYILRSDGGVDVSKLVRSMGGTGTTKTAKVVLKERGITV